MLLWRHQQLLIWNITIHEVYSDTNVFSVTSRLWLLIYKFKISYFLRLLYRCNNLQTWMKEPILSVFSKFLSVVFFFLCCSIAFTFCGLKYHFSSVACKIPLMKPFPRQDLACKAFKVCYAFVGKWESTRVHASVRKSCNKAPMQTTRLNWTTDWLSYYYWWAKLFLLVYHWERWYVSMLCVFCKFCWGAANMLCATLRRSLVSREVMTFTWCMMQINELRYKIFYLYFERTINPEQTKGGETAHNMGSWLHFIKVAKAKRVHNMCV